MAQNKALCDAYTQNFNHLDRQWDALATPERTAAFIARHTADQTLAWRYAFDIGAPGGGSPYFCIFEGEFDDADAMGAAMASPEGQVVAADVPNYAPDGTVMISFDVVAGG